MSNNYVLEAQSRTDQGKGASRRLRRANKVPAIVYGAGKDPVAVALTHHVIEKYLDDEAFYSQILMLTVDGETEKVVLRDVQRHPSKALIMHMDFLRIDESQLIRMHVPLHFLNEESCPGVKLGGQVNHQLVEVEIDCLPSNLPEFLEVDLGGITIGESIHMSDLKLPSGVVLPGLLQGEEHDLAIVAIHKGRVETSETAEEEEAEEE